MLFCIDFVSGLTRPQYRGILHEYQDCQCIANIIHVLFSFPEYTGIYYGANLHAYKGMAKLLQFFMSIFYYGANLHA